MLNGLMDDGRWDPCDALLAYRTVHGRLMTVAVSIDLNPVEAVISMLFCLLAAPSVCLLSVSGTVFFFDISYLVPVQTSRMASAVSTVPLSITPDYGFKIARVVVGARGERASLLMIPREETAGTGARVASF